MKILNQLFLSFEFFPPKTQDGNNNLMDAALQLTKYHPHFFSVTFGAGGTTRKGTLETVKLLQNKTDINISPHLACLGCRRQELVGLLHYYKSMGIRRIVALRGDFTGNLNQSSEFTYASELVAFIRKEMGDYFHIEVAAYPEIHPQARSVSDDVLNLKRKYEAGANGAITQYFFNPDAYFYFVDECAKQGIDLPIVPGIMPFTQFERLFNFSAKCGAEIPLWMRKRLESFADDIESVKKFAIDVVFHLCQQLIAGGAPGLHFYTLNKAEPTVEIVQMLGFLEATLHSRKTAKIVREAG